MKKTKRLWAGLLAALCLFTGLGAAASSGNLENLASLSYLTGTFLPVLEKGIADRAKADTQEVADAARARVDALGNQYSTGEPVPVPQPTVLSGGDIVTLEEGGSLVWLAGTGSAGQGLVDATSGTEVPPGGRLTAGHRYLNGLEGTEVQITALSDKAQAAPAGRWILTQSGRDVTYFYDLCQNEWFYNGVRWAISQGLFNGVSATEFAPYGTVDRSTLTTLLYRLAGSPQIRYQGLFSDVPANQWYTPGVEWAAANGIAGGNEDGAFSPTRAVSREEIMVMFYRLAGYFNLDTTSSVSLEGFYDSGSISPDARDAVAWAVGAGIINGSDGGLLPHDNTNRAQVALIFQRFQSWRESV